MDNKDAKLIEELFWKDDPMKFNFRTFEEIEEHLKKVKSEKRPLPPERQKINFEERYKYISTLSVLEKNEAEALNQYFDSLPISDQTPHYILTIGIYKAYKTGDMAILKNALHTYNRLKYVMKMTIISGSIGHARNFAEVIYALADGDLELIKKYFPEKLGLVKKGNHHMVFGSNLVISLLYSNEEWLKESMSAAEKMNEKSNLKSSILVIRYLTALGQQDLKLASTLLQEIAEMYKKITWLLNFNSPFLKFFGAYIHGLYNLGHFVLSAEKFSELKPPEHTVFWKEFDKHTKENNFNKGKICLNLDGLSELDRLFAF